MGAVLRADPKIGASPNLDFGLSHFGKKVSKVKETEY